MFPGENENDQLGLILEICGAPNSTVLNKASRAKLFFDENGKPQLKANSRGKVRREFTKTLQGVLRCKDKLFLHFLMCCFEWDPSLRIKPKQALMHPWIIDGLPAKVLNQHKRMLGINDDDLHETNYRSSERRTSNGREKVVAQNWMKHS